MIHLVIAIMALAAFSGGWWLFNKSIESRNTTNTPVVTATPTNSPGIMCGGFADIACPTGYICSVTETYPDASGYCVPSGNLFPLDQ